MLKYVCQQPLAAMALSFGVLVLASPDRATALPSHGGGARPRLLRIIWPHGRAVFVFFGRGPRGRAWRDSWPRETYRWKMASSRRIALC